MSSVVRVLVGSVIIAGGLSRGCESDHWASLLRSKMCPRSRRAASRFTVSPEPSQMRGKIAEDAESEGGKREDEERRDESERLDHLRFRSAIEGDLMGTEITGMSANVRCATARDQLVLSFEDPSRLLCNTQRTYCTSIPSYLHSLVAHNQICVRTSRFSTSHQAWHCHLPPAASTSNSERLRPVVLWHINVYAEDSAGRAI